MEDNNNNNTLTNAAPMCFNMPSELAPVAFEVVRPFPTLGITLNGMRDFIARCGGIERFAGLTTTQVCERLLKPLTEDVGSSYCDYLAKSSNESNLKFVGTANVFISHAWKYQFTNVMGALELHFEKKVSSSLSSAFSCVEERGEVRGEDMDSHDNSRGNRGSHTSKDGENGKVIYLWFDLFSNNQHGLEKPPPFQWWCDTFMNAIRDIGRVVMVMEPWDDPIPLTRVWCLWEVYCANKMKSKFEVAMSEEQRDRFRSMILTNSDSFFGMLANVDVQRSEAWNPLDKDQIFKVIKDTVGFHQLNIMVISCLRTWVVEDLLDYLKVLKAEAQTQLDGLSDAVVASPVKDQARGADSGTKSVLSASALEITTLDSDVIENDGGGGGGARGRRSGSNLDEMPPPIPFSPRALPGLRQTPLTVLVNHQEALAMLYKNQGKYQEAEVLLVSCLDLRRRELGERDALTLSTMSSLGTILCSRGKYKEAESTFTVCLERRREILIAAHPDTLTTMSNLANTYSCLGRLVEAETLHRECMELRKMSLDPSHPDVLTSMINLADACTKQTKYREAELLLDDCLERGRKGLDSNHPLLLAAVNNLANVYSLQHKLVKAQAIYKDCLQKLKEKLGADHPDTLVLMCNLASVCLASREMETAESLLRDCLARRRRVLGEDHPLTLTCINNLANVRCSQSDYSEAIVLYESCLKLSKTSVADNHPDKLTWIHNLAEAFYQLESYQDAEKRHNECLETCRKFHSPTHPMVITTKFSLAKLYALTHRLNAAEVLLTEILRTEGASSNTAQTSPSTNPDPFFTPNAAASSSMKSARQRPQDEILSWKHTLGCVYLEQGRLKEAEVILKFVLTARQDRLRRDDIDLVRSLHSVCCTVLLLHQYEEARTLYLQLLPVQIAVFGEGCDEALTSIRALAHISYKLKRYNQAEEYFQKFWSSKSAQHGPNRPSKRSDPTNATTWGPTPLSLLGKRHVLKYKVSEIRSPAFALDAGTEEAKVYWHNKKFSSAILTMRRDIAESGKAKMGANLTTASAVTRIPAMYCCHPCQSMRTVCCFTDATLDVCVDRCALAFALPCTPCIICLSDVGKKGDSNILTVICCPCSLVIIPLACLGMCCGFCCAVGMCAAAAGKNKVRPN